MKKIIFIVLLFAAGCGEESHLWPGGVIPFISIGLDAEETQIVLDAIAKWELKSGGLIAFEPTDQIGDGVLHIMFTELDDNVGGAASVGFRPGKPAYLFLNAKYFTLYSEIFDVNVITTHELGHVIGLDDDPNDLMSIMFPILCENSTGKQISPSDAESVRTMYELQ
jgi:hypothetical protein